MCSKITGTALNDLTHLHKVRSVRKTRLILSDPDRPLCDQLRLLPSRRRYLLQRCRTNRLKGSFIPAADVMFIIHDVPLAVKPIAPRG